MNRSDSITKIAPALVKASKSIHGALKDSKNPHYRSDYASLESVIEAGKRALGENGIVVLQLSGMGTSGPYIETTMLHESGEFISGEFPIIATSNDPQKFGSATTYARRYALAAALNIAQVDDDGSAASSGEGVRPDSYGQPRDGVDGVHDDTYRIPYAPYAKWTIEDLVNRHGREKLEEMVDGMRGVLSGNVPSRRNMNDPATRTKAEEFVQHGLTYIMALDGKTSGAS